MGCMSCSEKATSLIVHRLKPSSAAFCLANVMSKTWSGFELAVVRQSGHSASETVLEKPIEAYLFSRHIRPRYPCRGADRRPPDHPKSRSPDDSSPQWQRSFPPCPARVPGLVWVWELHFRPGQQP